MHTGRVHAWVQHSNCLLLCTGPTCCHMPADWPASNYCAPGSMLISPCHPCLRACFHRCRCEVDGQKVPISQHTSGKLSDQATSCQAVLTYNPTSTSRRNVTVPQGVLSNKFMAGKVRQHLMLQ
jgi:hypothetical protein